jgi:hypothetical protein
MDKLRIFFLARDSLKRNTTWCSGLKYEEARRREVWISKT